MNVLQQKEAMSKSSIASASKKLFHLINLEKKEVSYIYFFAVLIGIIQLSFPLGIQAIIGLLVGGMLSASLVVLIGFVVVGVLAGGIIQIMQMRVTENIQQRIFTRLTFAYAYRIPKINLQNSENQYLPELVNRFFDTTGLQKGMAKMLLDIPTASIQIFFGLLLLSFYHPLFAIFGLILLLFICITIYGSSSKGMTSSMEESDYKYKVGHWLEEISRAIKTFKFSQTSQLHLKKIDTLTMGYLDSRRLHFSVLVFQYRVLIAFRVLITAAMLIIGTLLFLKQQINLGQFIAAEIIIIAVLNSVEKLIMSLETAYDVLTAIEKLDHVLQSPQDIESDDDGFEKVELRKRFDISVSCLNFAYTSGKKILNNVSFDLKAGEKICIKGAEGSGKTTLIRVLAGLYTGYDGQILIDGIPLPNISLNDWRSRVAVFFAQEELFQGSLLENLTLGDDNLRLAEINEICAVVGLLPFVQSRAKGYQTSLDPEGQKLSYNVIQKILLARCLIKKPSLLMMENGWQGIEVKYRQQIIDKLILDKSFSLIVVSDLDELAEACDRTLRLADGEII